MTKTTKARFDALKVAVSTLALTVGAGLSQANAQSASDYGGTPGTSLDIVANHEVPPGPGNPATGANFANSPNVLNPLGSITGVGQQISFIQTGPASAGLLLCSGTLINPRTVITAAHCVYNNPAHRYGSDTGTGGGVNGPFGQSPPGTILTSQGIPLSFGFSSTNRCLGVAVNGCAVGTGAYEAWRDSNFSTNVARAIYNANQVWYNTNAQPIALGGGGEFANGDIALITLDTHVEDTPTWTLLFSPLDGPTHATITGYGGAGVGLSGIGSLAGIDYRRRSAENMIDALMTNHDWVSSPAINPGNNAFIAHQHPIYWMDFDDPDFQWDSSNVPANFFFNTAPPGGRNNGYYDFNGLGGPAPNGTALPNEGATAGGDSGGPLIVDQRWDIPVVAGVLTGSWSFNGGISTYGQFNVYPPLFQFWEQIVANNPYVYASALAGNGDWLDPSHWIQNMDPNYAIIGLDGELVNSLPDTHEGGGDGPVDRFGTLCFLELDCTTFDGPGNPTGAGTTVWTPATNFVPNNVEPINSATPGATVRARYYDVTLSASGATWLDDAVTIDRFAMTNGYALLDVQSGGSLSIWSDATIDAGWLNVNGTFNSGEMLVVQGIITGTGLINPTYLTSVFGAIAPASSDVGTLSIQGDVVLASGNNFFVEVGRNGADMLRILADPLQGTAGNISLGGALRMVKASNGPAPRHGQVFTLVLADGSVIDTFDQVYAQTGVLRPLVTYLPDAVQIELRAGRFADVIEGNVHELAFAHALDDLRDGSYNLLYDLYGELDVMDFGYLQHAFTALSPVSLFDAHGLIAMQESGFSTTLQNRMALLSRSDGGTLGISMIGAPGQVFAFGDAGLGAAPELAFTSSMAETTQLSNLPNGMSAFFSGGYDDSGASASAGRGSDSVDDGFRTWQMAGGVEQTFGGLTLGVAGGYSRGSAAQGGFGSLAENDIAQTAAYGVYRFPDGVYVSGLVGAGSSHVSMERRFAVGALDYNLQGDVEGNLYLGMIEAGVNLDLTQTLTVTPNASVRHYTVRTGAYDETGGEAALAFDEQQFERAEARLGLRLAGDVARGGWLISPALDASVVANLAGNEGGVWTRFADAPDVSFYLPGAARDDYWGEIIGGLRMVRGETSFALQFETSVGREEEYEDRYMARYAQRF
ncbi:MAG: autotransporter domain-containing protein [Caulobacteraceae bacterium]